MEGLLLPLQVLSILPAQRTLVFAPHPDDEVFGCGGALRHFISAGIALRVIVVTDGGEGPPEGMNRRSYVELRRNESRQAAERLGGYELVFWSYADRQLRYGERLVRECLAAIEEWQADMVLAPSHFEVHPDHRALAMSVLEATRRWGKARLALYEVGQPLPHPNVLLDISAVLKAKLAAVQCFASQLARQNYLVQIEALNRYRTYQTPGLEAAEAYILLAPEELSGQDPVGLFRSEHERQALLGLMADEARAPLVSIIVRSLDRPTLDEALNSIALQTYPKIEVILVNAKGPGHRPMPAWCGRFALRVVEEHRPLQRAVAANKGLEAAQGDFILFLDDDDCFDANHVATLVSGAIEISPHAQVVYSGVRTFGESPARIFHRDFDRLRLVAGNYIPIHAVLVARKLFESGCRFDEALSVYEDWDFLIQLALQTPFRKIEAVTAHYRILPGRGSGVHHDEMATMTARRYIYAKWRQSLTEHLTESEWFELLERIERLDDLHAALNEVQAEREALEAKWVKEHQEWERWNQEKASEIARLQAELEHARAVLQRQQAELALKDRRLQQLQAVAEELEAILSSWPWRACRYFLPAPKAILAGALAPVELVESAPLRLPAHVWPRSTKTLGGMRKLLRLVEVLGDRVTSRVNSLAIQSPGGRLLVFLDAGIEAVKVVLGVMGAQEVQLAVEFGELEGEIWHPVIRREVRIFPGWPCVLYLCLPKVVQTMALVFPQAGEVSFSQIAVISISPLEGKLGPWLWPLQQTVILLRSRSWRRFLRGVKRYGWRGAISIARQRWAGEVKVTEGVPVISQPADASQDPYAYAAKNKKKDLCGAKLAVLSSSRGNFFMREIAKALAQGAEKLGAQVMLGDEQDKIDPKEVDWVIVVAPHEFFTLGKGVGRFSQLARHSESFLLVNTEQPQTQWFSTALKFLPAARAVLDIHYQTAVHLRRLGIRSYFVPIAELASEASQVFPDHPALAWLPPELRECVPQSYQERPFDVVFFGTASPKRKAFFARHAGFFANLETFIYLPEGDKPFVPGDQRALDFATLAWLIRRTKIVLNLHRDDCPYLEWQRIVSLGILQKTLVISEPCDFCPVLRANEDYLDVPLDLIPTVCAYYLGQPKEAEHFALRAFSRLQTELAMEKILSHLFAELEAQ